MTKEQLDARLRKFWEIDDLSCPTCQYQVDPVEQHFIENTIIDTARRYIVTLPKKASHVS